MENKIKNIIAKFVKIPSNTEGVIFKFEKLKSGHINDTFKIEISDALNPPKSYILQNINTNIFIEPLKIMHNIETVATHLKSKDYTKQILSCLKTLDGNFLYTDEENRVWRVLPFIENTHSVLSTKSCDLKQTDKSGTSSDRLTTLRHKEVWRCLSPLPI